MLWEVIALIIGVAIVCECISKCVTIKYEHQSTCCCDDCMYREECWEVYINEKNKS